MTRRTVLWLVLAVAAIAGGSYGIWWWINRRDNESNELRLYGNLDLRQVQLAFNNSERIVTVKVQEGDSVHEGQVLAELDTSRLMPQLEQARAQVGAQEQVVARLNNGSRPQEIAQGEANLDSALAEANNARRQYDRLKSLAAVRLKDNVEARAVSQEDVDNAKAALQVADAKVEVNRKALDLLKLGPRKEEKAENQARLEALKAQLALLEQQVKDARLVAPGEGVIRSRLLEPGDMASPQRPVFTIAIITPKWVRAYVSESDLGKVRRDMQVAVTVDSFPREPFVGWIGFISSVAEFTPKTVQTEELRTSLVYEVRVFVKDPDDKLRLGMPATVHIPLGSKEQR
jgi:HlyD family secretion protein